MRQKTNGKMTGRGKRKEWMLWAGLPAYLIGLIARIPLVRIMGDKGLGFFAAGMELFAVTSAVLCYGISKSVSLLVKYRVKRDMVKSARKIYRTAMFFTVIVGGLAAAFLFFFAEFIAETVVLEYRAYMAVAAVAPAVFLTGVLGVMRGYLQGMGAVTPTVHSRLLEKAMMLLAGLVLAGALFSYGEKVAAVLRNSEYAAAYGAEGAAIGVSVACGFGVIHLLLMKLAYSGSFKQQLARDSAKYVESGGQIFSMFFSTALPYMLCALLYNMYYLVDQRVFNYTMNKQGKEAVRAAHWGVYYGKYSTVVGIVAIACTMAVVSGIPKIAQMFDKQEYNEARYRIGSMVHTLAVLTIPCAVWIAVLAEPLSGMLFTGDQDTSVKLLRAGSSVVVFFAFAYFFMSLLQRIRKIWTVIIGGFAAFVVHLLFLFVLIRSTELGIVAVALGLLVFWLTVCVTGFVGTMQSLSFSLDWVRAFGVTAIAAGVSGLLGLLLVKLLLPALGNAATFLIGFLLCALVYLVLLIVLKGVREDELEDMPGGQIIVVLAEKVNLM